MRVFVTVPFFYFSTGRFLSAIYKEPFLIVKNYFKHIFAFFICQFLPGFPMESTCLIDLTRDSGIKNKIYIDPNTVYISSEGIFLNVNGNLIPILSLEKDEHGIFTPNDFYYSPWHDDDWQCKSGHWSPRYESRCVTCGKLKTPDSRRWKDVQ